MPFLLARHRIACVATLFLLTVCSGCRQEPWALWQSYAARFIDAGGRVIDPSGNRTTSEGQADALFFALVANDRPRFAKLLEWTEYNLAQGDFEYHLPARLWGKDKNGAWKALDPNSASNADLWLAYTLLQAGRLWKEPGYTKLGRQLMAQIARYEVVDLPGFGPMLAPGPVGFEHKGVWTLNPSYLPAFVLEGLASEDPNGPWRKIAGNVPRLIRESSRQGYAMDWVSYVPGGGLAAAQSADGAPPQGSSDAIRVYLWAGMMDDKDSLRAEILSALPAMSAYLANHDAPPDSVSGEGAPSGNPGTVGFSAAVMPYLRATQGGGKALVKQVIRLNTEKDPASGMYGNGSAYFDQNLALFATGFMDQRFHIGPHGELTVQWSIL